MLKKILLTTIGILLAASTAGAQDYFTDANISACQRQLPDMDNGDNMCRLLEAMDDNFAGVTGTTGAYDVGFDAAGAYTAAASNVGAALGELVTSGATTGSNLIPHDDSVNKTSNTNVGDDLDELFSHVVTANATLPINLAACRLEAGGPILAYSNGAAAGFAQVNTSKEVVWKSDSDSTIACTFALPDDMDVTQPFYIKFWAKGDGAGTADQIDVEAYAFKAADEDNADLISTGITATTGTLDLISFTGGAVTIALPAGISLIITMDYGDFDFQVYGAYMQYTSKARL
jgi:hypothetical protein